jgi:myo-inositol-1(or 4)-monophosphatase
LNNVSHSTTLAGLVQGVQAVAAFIEAERATFQSSQIEYKGYNDLVSYVDREAEMRLRSCCADLLPGSGFIGEEGGSSHADAEYVWIADPLDGTTNFIHGIPAYSISVALQQRGQTILGVVHDVPHRETFSALLGGGAYLNGNRIHVSAAADLRAALLATGFPYANSGLLDDYLTVMKAFLEMGHGMRRFGSAAIDLAWVACGRLDGYYELGLQPWDVAAGGLLVAEAGGSVTDFKGTANYVFGRQLVASNKAIHADMLDVIGQRY